MKFPAFHHRKFQTQLFSLKPMTSSCHVRIVNEIDKRASQPASLLRRLWQLQGKNPKGRRRRRRRNDAAAKCANLFRLICIQTNFLTPIPSYASHLQVEVVTKGSLQGIAIFSKPNLTTCMREGNLSKVKKGKVIPLQARCGPQVWYSYSSTLPWPRH